MYRPQGILSTSFKFSLMVAESAAAQEILGVADAAEAERLVTTYTEEALSVPRCIVHENDIHTESDDLGNNLNISDRMVGCEFFVYVPRPADFRLLPGWEGAADGKVLIKDERSYIADKFGSILDEIMDQSGQPGKLALYDPVIYEQERIPEPERFDHDELELGEEARSVWYGTLAFHVR